MIKKIFILIFGLLILFSSCNKKNEAEVFTGEVFAALDAENYTVLTLLIDKDIRETNQSQYLIRNFVKYKQTYKLLISRKFISEKNEDSRTGEKMILEYRCKYADKNVHEYLTVKKRDDDFKIYNFEFSEE